MGIKNFLKRFQAEYLAQALVDTFARFPLSLTCCLAACLLSILEVHDIKPLSDDAMARTSLFLAYGLVFFTAARLYAEGSGASRVKESLVLLGGGAALFVLCFCVAHISPMHAFVGAGLVFTMLYAPYLGRNSAEDSVWYFNYQNGISLVVAGISTVILCTGACAIVGGMDYLLYDMKLSGKIYGDIWIFGATFFGPVGFMHQIARQYDYEKSECAVPRGISFIANFIVVPLVLIYMWVLYVYFLKMAVQWELPKGNLAYMVTGFGSAGAAARLAVFPLREQGTKLLQQFYRFFYYIMIVPLLLLAIGLYTRLSQYGVTEDRYAIGISLVWLSALAAWNIARPASAHIKHVPIVLSVLFLVAAVGPWGAVSVSTHSQTDRLKGLLRDAGVIHPDGTIAKTEQEVPFTLRKDISGTLDYMLDGKEEAIDRFVAPFHDEIAKKRKEQTGNSAVSTDGGRNGFLGDPYNYYNQPANLMEAMGMRYVSRWEARGDASGENESFRVYYYGEGAHTVTKVAPYAYLGTFSPTVYAHGGCTVDPESGDSSPAFKVDAGLSGDGLVTVTLGDGRKDVFDLKPMSEAFYKEKVETVPAAERGKLVVKPAPDAGFPAEMHVTSVDGGAHGGKLDFRDVTFTILFKP